jgi:hypothetical protein
LSFWRRRKLAAKQVLGSGIDPYQLNENGRLYFDIGKDKGGRDVAINIKLP